MSRPAELQSAFALALHDPDSGVPPGLDPGSAGRFDVHRNNMVAGLVDALRSTYPAIERLVGEQYFAAAARAYVRAEPPQSPVLLYYGGSFPGFLESLPAASTVPYLGDVARLEWARLRALHAADAAPAPVQALAGLDGADLEAVRLELHSSLCLLRSRWPVVSLWSDCMGVGSPAHIELHAAEVAVVLRPGLNVRVHAAPPGAAALLEAVQTGASLGAAMRQSMTSDDAEAIAAQLRYLFDIGAVAAVGFTETEI
ncbi:MAG TPA: DNA-binding domain-containing protein [Arenicellales bacterium]|nr:DNA-binding domain-containing protein [Arenicellales bacterium]